MSMQKMRSCYLAHGIRVSVPVQHDVYSFFDHHSGKHSHPLRTTCMCISVYIYMEKENFLSLRSRDVGEYSD